MDLDLRSLILFDDNENCHGNYDINDGDDLHLAIEQSFDKSVGSVERR